MSIGYAGLGNVGAALAARLQLSHALKVYDLDEASVRLLTEKGARAIQARAAGAFRDQSERVRCWWHRRRAFDQAGQQHALRRAASAVAGSNGVSGEERRRRVPRCLPKGRDREVGKAVYESNLAGTLLVEGLKRGDKLQRSKGV